VELQELVWADGGGGKQGCEFGGHLQSYVESQRTELNSVRRRACSFPLGSEVCVVVSAGALIEGWWGRRVTSPRGAAAAGLECCSLQQSIQ
jgi:hypothetical protein